MTRNEFRLAVFERDDHKCVICDAPGQDAHHLLERRLWSDGGYHLNNGATLCSEHHIRAEQTLLGVDEIREAAGITVVVLPEHLYSDNKYDKWGNIILPNGQRMRGELFYDPSVLKILTRVLHQFTDYVKYPRTYHLPWSPGGTKDDRTLNSTSMFEGRDVVVTEKMDGENTTLYTHYIHARSIDGISHSSQSWVKNFHAKMSWQIPSNWRVCGENLFATHSIRYTNLSSYFLAFSMWSGDRCISWAKTLEWFELMNIASVPVLYTGPWDEDLIRNLDVKGEGYVVRLVDEFLYTNFRTSVAKYVRAGHVTTSHNWRRNYQQNEMG